MVAAAGAAGPETGSVERVDARLYLFGSFGVIVGAQAVFDEKDGATSVGFVVFFDNGHQSALRIGRRWAVTVRLRDRQSGQG